MTEQWKKFFRYIGVLLVIVAAYLIFLFTYNLLGLPKPEEIIKFTTVYYEKYGYWVVLLGAIGEGLLLINWYFPGSIVVALGVVIAREAGLDVPFMLLLVIFGFFLTAIFNYVLGRFGWYHVLLKFGLRAPLEKVQTKIGEKGLKILFTTYVHPNFGALAATAAGILHLSFLKFALYSLISITIWNTLWTILFYHFGSILLNHVNILILVGAIFVYFMFRHSFKESPVNIP
ncbi:hypothetical protein A3I95_01785 [Candidatus Nomurabacteria bacterium RIFCSPLOWO2_02_FULL_44_12]|uniref:VTT domain-containing protein n=1 Tax=Candidatus Nomurabacteria bacterium RIFCSPLOWO2_12_FULL_44_11 TaxID=1801796 RepID=A0A1F6Y6H8_9BACT|nr:MAG: hypothetical protein A3E95_01355 [Candidatus Nomurabacteria bacterium RIFCSPHIGHO2_12_FULL_44_22b]OGJ01949.1 MAG: hypothetical protein A3G53_01530 [Candidatus Nomurabacteria bacterium RIFCSPLOWO2_12_FULL_44_11]OGJ08606.1 MAG: hypothetical protein A3I95_01785 [Candidatus Nomurabacteria bacterium RIFCSPLOWO2_02_FULL_44_12]